jgi:hypothetical protein
MKRETQAKRAQESKDMQKFEAAPTDDDGLLEELGGLEDSDEEEEEQPVEVQKEEEDSAFFNDKVKKELQAFRQMKKVNMMNHQTADSNLEQIFSNFKVFKQQRHKISLQDVKEFAVDETGSEVEQARKNLVT